MGKMRQLQPVTGDVIKDGVIKDYKREHPWGNKEAEQAYFKKLKAQDEKMGIKRNWGYRLP